MHNLSSKYFGFQSILRSLFTALLCCFFSIGYSQELNCNITVNAPKNQNVDPQVFRNMESFFREFLNGRKWTNDNYKDAERIRCNIIINITEIPTEGEYRASAIIQSQRPVFNSNYNTTMLNLQDKSFDFAYSDLQNLEYNDNGFSSQITSLLAYYAYIILAYDYESFGKEGGSNYFQRAQLLCNNVPANEKSKYKGWSQFDGGISFTTSTINRFVLADNWLNPRYKDMRTAFYSYHLNGLDKLYTDAFQSRSAITSSLMILQKINTDNPGLLPLRNFFIAKSSELINIYSKSDMAERTMIIQLLSSLDPINSDKYKQIGKI